MSDGWTIDGETDWLLEGLQRDHAIVVELTKHGRLLDADKYVKDCLFDDRLAVYLRLTENRDGTGPNRGRWEASGAG